MPRTTPGEVEGALGDDYACGRPLTIFIRMASSFVDRVVECATRKGFTHTATELKDLETLVAAHAYQASDPGYASKTTAGASASFLGQAGMKFDATRYGQLAQTMDASGCVAALGQRKTATMDWLGKPPSEQIPYDQRD